ncbi:MAG: chromatin modification- protein VID21 [Cirrosporium novae-zelandiae]|nr:MAG: chromatin modification- protein VID21 [Cirrosporium novae-zelandiae]
MLRDSLLQVKKDELAAVITSRKRKLSELFYVSTANLAAESIPQHPGLASTKPLSQQELTFLEANDIIKGRLFDESTLPTPPSSSSIAIETQKDANTGTSLDFTTVRTSQLLPSIPPLISQKIDSKATEARGQKKPDALHSDGSGESNIGPAQSASLVGNTNQALATEQLLLEGNIIQPSAPESLGHPIDRPNDAERNAREPPGETQPANTHSPAPSAEIISATAGVDSSKAPPTDDVGSLSYAQLESTEGDGTKGPRTTQLPTKDVQERHVQDLGREGAGRPGLQVDTEKPIAIFRGGGNIELTSSPSSTVGHYSVNTPGMTAGSPDTSPENPPDDVHVKLSPDQVSEPTQSPQEFRSDAGSQPRPAITPQVIVTGTMVSTPDAQLHLEEAQAMHPTLVRKNQAVLDQATGFGDTVNEVTDQAMPDRETEQSSDSGLVVAAPAPTSHSGIIRESTDVKTRDQIKTQRPATPAPTEPTPPSPTEDEPNVLEHGEPSPATSQKRSDGSDNTPPTSKTSFNSSMDRSSEGLATQGSINVLSHDPVAKVAAETPKAIGIGSDKTGIEKPSTRSSRSQSMANADASASESATPRTPSIRSRTVERREREKERGQLSTVVFSKYPETGIPNLTRRQSSQDLQTPRNDPRAAKDYFYSLFAAHAQPRSHSLGALLATAHKTVTTANQYVHVHEQQDCHILKRIHAFQSNHRWSLRQVARAEEPPRPKVQWDLLLAHAKWLRTDYREERKWKIAAAKIVADWCAEWAACSPEERHLLQVKAKIPPKANAHDDRSENIAAKGELYQLDEMQCTPDLIPSTENDSVSEVDMDGDATPPAITSIAPAALFSLTPEEIAFHMEKTPASDRLLQELPLYGPLSDFQYHVSSLSTLEAPPDVAFSNQVLPVTKYANAKFIYDQPKPQRKKSRYDYENEDEDSYRSSKRAKLEPDDDSVALFRPDQKSLRDRIHPGYSFRPPSEFPMPHQSFYENRHSSQWTWNEDDELRTLVRDYSYNWSLISSCLSSSSLFSSGAERRTPWECFERWITLEGLPADMSKTPYFRAYLARVEAAEKTVLLQMHAAQQQQQLQHPNQPQAPIRRRSIRPIRVDRRRNTKHLALFRAITTLVKKREEAVVKQQRAAALASMRKQNEMVQQKPPPGLDTPEGVSRMKFEREQMYREQAAKMQLQYQQQMVQRHQQMARAQAQQGGQSTGLPTGAMQQNHNGHGPGSSLSPLSALPNGHSHNGVQQRLHPSLQGMPGSSMINGVLPPNIQMARNPIPPLAPGMNGLQRQQGQMSPENVRVFMEANRVQQQQQNYLQRQQQQQQQQMAIQMQHPNQNGPSGASSVGGMASPANNPAMLAAMHHSGISSPSIPNAMVGVGPSGPPRNHPQSLSNSTVPAVASIIAQMQAQNPHASHDQIKAMANEQLARFQARASQQAAMNAAAGNFKEGALHTPMQQLRATPGGIQAYSQMMRQQHPSQQQNQAGSGTMTGPRPPSRSATPQSQRTGGMQPGSIQQSPRPPPAQMAGG